MRYVVDVLDDLGLSAHLKVVRDTAAYFTLIYPPTGGQPGTSAGTRRHSHVYMTGWFADYPAAGNFIAPQSACGERGFANPSGWCSETLEAQIDEALPLAASDPDVANRAWMEIEHGLVEEAARACANGASSHGLRVGLRGPSGF